MKENQDALEKDTIAPKDWKMLRTIHSFLLPFYRATMDLQGDSARIDKVLIRMDALLTHTERSVVRLPPTPLPSALLTLTRLSSKGKTRRSIRSLPHELIIAGRSFAYTTSIRTTLHIMLQL